VKVHQLISLLLRAPQNAEVTTEGCDCTGDSAAIELLEDEVMILRGGKHLINCQDENVLLPDTRAKYDLLNDGDCESCDGAYCTAGPKCVALSNPPNVKSHE
jgi:hypothetical protein